nr:MAG TPA: hypothetical protein [Caudoviricetes sp.]
MQRGRWAARKFRSRCTWFITGMKRTGGGTRTISARLGARLFRTRW